MSEFFFRVDEPGIILLLEGSEKPGNFVFVSAFKVRLVPPCSLITFCKAFVTSMQWRGLCSCPYVALSNTKPSLKLFVSLISPSNCECNLTVSIVSFNSFTHPRCSSGEDAAKVMTFFSSVILKSAKQSVIIKSCAVQKLRTVAKIGKIRFGKVEFIHVVETQALAVAAFILRRNNQQIREHEHLKHERVR